ncbi:MAG TPA: sugar transferase [Acidobacteriaceae bacterium]
MPEEFFTSESQGSTAAAGVYSYPEVEAAGGPILVREYPGPQRFFRYRVIKRTLDIVLVVLATPVLAPLFLAVAAAVRFSSPGPVLFSHRRIRKHGEFFSMWKFRTMCVDSAQVLEDYLTANPGARKEWRENHKLKRDPRVTRVGAFLRRMSLDELPQFWNVLQGTMSLVGPRPIVAAEVEKYGDNFDEYCKVKPGLTGLWQVSGRNEVSYEQRVQLDCRYVRSWSLLEDAKIMSRTLSSVVNQDGAY